MSSHHCDLGSTEERILAIDFGGTKVGIGLSDRNGGHVTTREEFAPGTPASDVLQQAERMALALLKRTTSASGTGPDIDVVSMVTPGRVVDGSLSLAPNVQGWEQIDLAQWGHRCWPGARVTLTNDVAAAATAECSTGKLVGCDIGIYLNLGTGIACVATIDGRVLNGHSGLAGEIDYAFSGESSDQWGTRESRLEEIAGGKTFAARGLRIPSAPERGGSLPLSTRDLLDEVARHLLTCQLLIDPQRIVVGGGMGRLPPVINHLRDRLNSAGLREIDLVASGFGADASLAGAFAVCAQ